MSTPLTATEDLGISLQMLREMVASSETFQADIKGGYGDAIERVYIGRQLGSPERPFAIIESDGLTANLVGGGSQNYLRLSGRITLHMERDTNTDADDYYTDANEFFGGVVADVQSLAAVDNTDGEFDQSHLPVIQVEYGRPDENDLKDWPTLGRFFVSRSTISWGDG